VTVIIQDAARRPGTPAERTIRAWASAAAGDERGGEITVRIVTEDESAELNRRYRRGKGATNVLAFVAEPECPDLGDDLPPIGDIVVCADVLSRETAALGKSLDEHWAHVVIHGTLHLLGYDHSNERDARVMEQRERELLADLGYGDPYAAD
jgi:probable rRNA maturation factor